LSDPKLATAIELANAESFTVRQIAKGIESDELSHR
jgi:hypothetical protein